MRLKCSGKNGRGGSDFRVKMSRNRVIAHRVSQLKRRLKLTPRRCGVTQFKDQELFNLAASLAKGKFETQKVDGETEKATMKQRQLWARVAAYIA